jgi:hypothetical protein
MELEPMSKKHVKALIKKAVESSDREGSAQMRLTQAAVNAANAMMQLKQIEIMCK